MPRQNFFENDVKHEKKEASVERSTEASFFRPRVRLAPIL
jgi:hypothetical protein